MAATSPRPGGTAGRPGSDDASRPDDPLGSSTERSAEGTSEDASIRKLEADIRKLREDVAALTRHLKETGGDTYKSARKAASESAEQIRAQGEAALENLRESAQDVGEQVSGAVRRKPFTALAIAAAVGYLLAMSRR
jgi:ElaB/YqjD/DUF883 family membrane-anchored ribosome-binding protein